MPQAKLACCAFASGRLPGGDLGKWHRHMDHHSLKVLPEDFGLRSISPEPLPRSSTRVPASRRSAAPRVASFSGVNGLWMR